ncbi:MAG: LysR family transcriptional regulator [Bdellovibrionota bacterium]
MEINEIKYFLAVAKFENIHRASEDIGISTGSLSKAIKKLEDELSVKLFRREGRNIRLTEYGRFLKHKGYELLTLENSIRSEIVGSDNGFKIVIAGSEILISHFGVEIASNIKNRYPNVAIQFEVLEGSELISRVRDGEVDLGLTTYNLPKYFDQKIINSIEFNTYISRKHVLFPKFKKSSSLPIETVLQYPFVVPQKNIFGKISKSDSNDGWRDDMLPRQIMYTSASLKTIEALVLHGDAIAYLPEYFGVKSGFEKLKVDGCPYHCSQKVKLFTKNKQRSGWLNSVF